jgi:hypothetical protein
MRAGRSSGQQANPVAVGPRADQMGSERLVKTAEHRRPQRPDEGIGFDREEQSFLVAQGVTPGKELLGPTRPPLGAEGWGALPRTRA